MLTRLAILEGRVKPGQEAAMRAYVEAELAPLWRQFQPSEEVRILYAAEAGDIPLVLHQRSLIRTHGPTFGVRLR